MARTLGDFEISDTLLGRGGMASVYLGRQISLDVPRAIKILHPAFADDRDFISRFEREAKHGAAISHHPNIVGVVSYGNHEGSYYIAMELVEGTDLKSVLDRHAPLPPEIALILLEEAAKGLEVAHKLDIWHRDVKPSNVLLRRTGEVQIADFGLARNNRDRERLAQDMMTMPGTVMGTLAYMSPEQHEGWDDNKIDHRTDIFSLGVMAYELLTGHRPFRGTESEIREQALGADPEPVVRNCPLATPAVERVVAKCLAKKPENRCGSMSEVLGLIREAMTSLDPDEDILKYRREYMGEFAADAGTFCKKLNDRNIEKNLARGGELLEQEPPATAPAIIAYSRVLLLDPNNAEAEAALARLRGESEATRTSIDRTFPNRKWKKGAAPGKPSPPSKAIPEKPGSRGKRGLLLAVALGIPVVLAAGYFVFSSMSRKDGETGGAPVSVNLNVRSSPAGAAVFARSPGEPGFPAVAGTTNTALTLAGAGSWEFLFNLPGYRDTTILMDVGESPSLLSVNLSRLPDTGIVASTPETTVVSPPQTSAPRQPDTRTRAQEPVLEDDATISIRILTPADIYLDGEMVESQARGTRSFPVSSSRKHVLELRSPGGNKTFSGLQPNPYRLLDLKEWELVGESWVESN